MLRFMQKPEKILLCVIFGLMLILAAVILVLKSRPADEDIIYNISVIVSDAGDSFSKGMNQAALDFNADVHIVQGYETDTADQRSEYISRETDNGASALVVVGSGQDPDAGNSVRGAVPVVCIGGRLGGAACTVTTDDTRSGAMLGELAVKYAPSGCRIVCPEKLEGRALVRYSALIKVLDERHIPYEVSFGSLSGGSSAQMLVVIDEKMTADVCRASGDNDTVIGVGYNNSLRDWLETGKIAALVVYSEYDIGYTSIRAAVEAIKNGGTAQDVTIGLYTADRENMYSDPVDKILFPIE